MNRTIMTLFLRAMRRAALRDAGLVAVRIDAQRRIYRVRPEPLQAVDEWLRPYRVLWSSRLDALEEHLHTMHVHDTPNEENDADD